MPWEWSPLSAMVPLVLDHPAELSNPQTEGTSTKPDSQDMVATANTVGACPSLQGSSVPHPCNTEILWSSRDKLIRDPSSEKHSPYRVRCPC